MVVETVIDECRNIVNKITISVYGDYWHLKDSKQHLWGCFSIKGDHVVRDRCILLNTGVFSAKSYRCRVVGICGLKIVSRGDLIGIWVTSE